MMNIVMFESFKVDIKKNGKENVCFCPIKGQNGVNVLPLYIYYVTVLFCLYEASKIDIEKGSLLILSIELQDIPKKLNFGTLKLF